VTLCAEQPRECMEVLVMGAFNVFEAAVAAKVKKVVYASSASVYGGADLFPTDERHHPYNNRTLYGAAKAMNEGIARSFNEMYGLPSVGLRYFNIYGPRMDVTGAYTEVFVRWLECIERDVPPQIHGDGSATMDFVYVEDVARANILALKSERADDVYNVASGKETSLLELWQAIQDISGVHHLTPEFHPPRKVNPVPRRLADIRRARPELHGGPSSGPACPRRGAGGRGHHGQPQLHRHRQRDSLLRRETGLRRCGSADIQHGSMPPGEGHHAAYQGHPAGASDRPAL